MPDPSLIDGKKLDYLVVISNECCLLYFTDGSCVEAYRSKRNKSYMQVRRKVEPHMLKVLDQYWGYDE